MRPSLLLLALVGASLLALVSAAPSASVGLGPVPTSCSGAPNNQPLVQFDAQTAKPLGSVPNGTLEAVIPYGTVTPLLVLHLYGDDYSMGVAYGSLLKSELTEMIPATYAYFSQKFNLSADLINDLLDMTCNTTKSFTPAWHFDFLRGVADGSDGVVSFQTIWRIAMFPELIKATCSIMGAWGPATAQGTGLLQLRALDWGTDSPLQRFPMLTTFHPNDGSFAYSSLGWAGVYGTLTGWSSSNLAVSEKVWYEYSKLDNIFGYPWTLMLADIMRFDMDTDAALARIAGATRTCAIWLGFGQGERPNPLNDTLPALPASFTLVQDSFQEIHFWNPENFPYGDFPKGSHDYYPGVLFVDKKVQPSGNVCMNDVLGWGYGQWTAPLVYQTLTAMEQTGDMHIAVMDFDAKRIYVANASPTPNASPAYNNGFVAFDMQSLWQQPQPQDL